MAHGKHSFILAARARVMIIRKAQPASHDSAVSFGARPEKEFAGVASLRAFWSVLVNFGHYPRLEYERLLPRSQEIVDLRL
jgi:hypothetical protein